MSDLPPPSTGGLPPPAPVPGPSPSWWRRRWAKLPVWGWIAIAAALVLVAIGAGVAASSSDETSTPATTTAPAPSTTLTTLNRSTLPPPATTTIPPATTTATTTAATTAPTTPTTRPTVAPPTTTVAPTTTARSTTTTASGPPSFGAGTKIVGTDIAPGRYITPGQTGCYWARLEDASGDLDAIIANDNTDWQAIVDIAPTDGAFESERCGRWVLYAAPATASDTFGDGSWVVNEQIVPGRYRSDGSGSCYWQRATDFSGGVDSIIANDNVDGSTVVDIKATDVAFTSNRCGTWTKVG